jgi:hypothetical protein
MENTDAETFFAGNLLFSFPELFKGAGNHSQLICSKLLIALQKVSIVGAVYGTISFVVRRRTADGRFRFETT